MPTFTRHAALRTLSAALVCALAPAALADTVTVKYLGKGKGSNVRITWNGHSENLFAGQLRHQLSDPVGPTAIGLIGEFRTFCSDLAQLVTSTPTTYSVLPVEAVPGSAPMGTDVAAAIRALYASAGFTAVLATASNDYATAFQLAIWELISDYNPGMGPASLSLTSGNFSATKTDGSPLSSSITSLANGFLSSLSAALPSSHQLLGLSSGTAQDQLVLIPTPGALAVVGLGGLLVARRRR
jgi:hypothetical protein